jgi:argininosuccinate lyase
LGEVECALILLAEIYPRLTIRESSFEKPCYAFTTSTELANMLTKKYSVPFRTAHKAVGALVSHLTANDIGSHEISATLVEAFLKETADLSLRIEVKDIEEAMDPTHFVERHDVRGGPAPNEVKRMIKTRGQRLQAIKTWRDSVRTIQSKAETALTRERRAYETSERSDKASSR